MLWIKTEKNCIGLGAISHKHIGHFTIYGEDC